MHKDGHLGLSGTSKLANRVTKLAKAPEMIKAVKMIRRAFNAFQGIRKKIAYQCQWQWWLPVTPRESLTSLESLKKTEESLSVSRSEKGKDSLVFSKGVQTDAKDSLCFSKDAKDSKHAKDGKGGTDVIQQVHGFTEVMGPFLHGT